jgi:hypothetical protein
MSSDIVISGDFSAPGSPLLAGPSEEGLRPTAALVASCDEPQIAALKQLGSGHRQALVIDHSFDGEQGWITSRRTFRRIPKGQAAIDRPPQVFDPDSL